ncbi:MAG: globin domain-containing protein [Pseudoruegeria sp.]
MTPAQIKRVKESYLELLPVHDEVAEAFYLGLFTAAPDTRLLFPKDMESQKDKFFQTMSLMVQFLNDQTILENVFGELGRNHKGYGVRVEHYDVVEDCLLTALAQKLGSSFTTEVREAWLQTYRVIVKTMKDAAA